MSFLIGYQTRMERNSGVSLTSIIAGLLLYGLLVANSARAQEAAGAIPAVAAAPAKGVPYIEAISLLPDTSAGVARIRNLPDFCAAWKKTHVGSLIDDPLMQPFIEAQRARAEHYFDSIDNKIGLRPQDLYDIASGEVVGAWLSFEKDKRRPYSFCVIADIRGRKQKADQAIDQIDNDLIAGGAKRNDVEHLGETVRVYTTTPKPGQLKIDEIVLTYNDDRVIAADRQRVVTDVLDAVAGNPAGKSIGESEEYKSLRTRVDESIDGIVQEQKATASLEWFARPFAMARILREVFEVDRGNQVDILKLLEGQGFDAIKSLGGSVVLAGKDIDFLHRGFVVAPSTDPGEQRYKLAARMLQMVDVQLSDIPQWVHPEVGSFNRINWRLEEVFWASETLINEAFGDDIFRPMIEGIRDDEEGPQIDIAKDVLPNLDDQVLLLTDNVLPAAVDSERMLLAIRVNNPAVIKDAIRKAMEVEPDASKMDALPGVEIWRVQRGEGEDDFEKDLFGSEGFGFEEEEAQQSPPLLEHWAIALVEQGAGADASYLIFSSHPDFMVQTAKRMKEGAQDALGDIPDVQRVVTTLKDLGAAQVAMDRVVRLKSTLRVKYELLRQGQLKDSDSVLFKLLRRLDEEEDGGQPDPLNASKLPPIDQIQQHLPEGGSYIETTEDGWMMTGFFLK